MIFFPKDAGKTKADVIEMIEERRADTDAYAGIKAADINKLTDERMQQFADEWFTAREAMLDALIDGFGAEQKADEMEVLLVVLAKEIQED